ncbi:MAG TPA: GNAT family N-acetyltransferase [Herpetosiphonaceae bacterium]|nr:GNAT family N-acetyltransferase [Herpetosiphonaceae bacterium]
MDLRRLEEAALNAWPAERQQLFDGWLLRCSGGYTKRANSVTPLYQATLDPAAKIAACERFYADQGLPCIFRLPSFAEGGLDDVLARRGYRELDRTLVLARDLHPSAAPPTRGSPAAPAAAEAALDGWLDAYSALSESSPAQRAGHRAILGRIAARPAYLLLRAGDTPLACGLGVLEGEHFGLFDIVVAAERRGQGLGRQLIDSLLAWAIGRGARRAYLQVVAGNAPARRLYDRLGFSEQYQYWYRQAPPEAGR